jgi:hypothetical protein
MTKPKAKKAAAPKPSNVFRRLSTVLLINSAKFAGLGAPAQTKTLAEANGLPIEFVPNFVGLSDKRTLRDNLLAGKDVSRELEFNEIVLTDEERVMLGKITPILAKINTIGPDYPWVAEQEFPEITFDEKNLKRHGHTLSLVKAKTAWNKASLYWSGGKKPAEYNAGTYYNSRYCTITENGIKMGCQTVTRAEAEYIARCQGWDPKVHEA